MVLGYSRLLWCRFYPRQDMRTLVSWLEDAFQYFGGVWNGAKAGENRVHDARSLRACEASC